MKRVSALIYGVAVYLFFLGTSLYAIAFVGNLGVARSIDRGLESGTLAAVLIDMLLLGVFAVQHSVMARPGFKRQWTRLVSWHLERSTYVVAATLALALVLWQWRPIPAIVWSVSGHFATVLRIAFWAGWGTVLTGTFLINQLELFGLEQVWAYFRGREFHRPSLRTPALYRVVRHPIYLGFLIAFWAAPVMTAGHLLCAFATTSYILLGIYFEEKDLLAAYGQAYLEYRRRVPMLIPFLHGPRAAESQQWDQGGVNQLEEERCRNF